MNEKGQAFSVFKLLISAVIAVVILTLLLTIINIINPIGRGDPAKEAGSLIRELSTTKAQYQRSQEVFFTKDKGINARQIADASQGNLVDDQVCVSAGDFEEEADRGLWTQTSNRALIYNGTDSRKAIIAGICDNGSKMDESDYFDDYTGSVIDSGWFSDCDCINPENTGVCCVVVVKRAT